MVTEIDGPPRAYFEVCGDAHIFNSTDDVVTEKKFEKVMLRFTYKAIYASSEEKLREFIQQVRDALEKEAGEDNGIIFWRRRVSSMETYTSGEPYSRSKETNWSCRLATSPPLPESWWSQFPFSDEFRQYRLD